MTLVLLSYITLCIFTINDLWLFLAVPWVDLQYVIVVFPDHTHLLFNVARQPFEKLDALLRDKLVIRRQYPPPIRYFQNILSKFHRCKIKFVSRSVPTKRRT